ncbi:MAG: mammalian cell entry protein [Mycobacterium sp.]
MTDTDTKPPDTATTEAAEEAIEEPVEAAAQSADDSGGDEQCGSRRSKVPMPPHRLALLVGLTIVAALMAVAGWLGWGAYQGNRVAEQQAQFLQAGRQGALNLTTIDWQHADADIQRILNSATGTFYDDFLKQSQPFIDVLKAAQARSEGTITAAGLESSSGNGAQILVAVGVKISNAGAPVQDPRAWRMRISVQKVGDDVKMSNVEFVP